MYVPSMSKSLESEWTSFLKDGNISVDDHALETNVLDKILPTCSDIHISTKTRVSYLNKPVELQKVFWKIPIMQHHTRRQGIVKKQMKFTCDTKEEYLELEEKAKDVKCIKIDTLKHIDNPAGHVKFKYVCKINVGISKKDILCHRSKSKRAFYNCCVLIIRVFFEGTYREINAKIFNTGKLSFPGIVSDELIAIAINGVVQLLRDVYDSEIYHIDDSIETVLINSNFNCGFYINRDKLYGILKNKYNIHVSYDQCSYPGIQCKYFANEENHSEDGVCRCSTKCSKKGMGTGDGECREISFMIFRTGSILIVGKCEEVTIMKIYSFIKRLLVAEYDNISIDNVGVTTSKFRKAKVKKRVIYIERAFPSSESPAIASTAN